MELELFLDMPVDFQRSDMPWLGDVVCVYWFTPGLQILVHHLKYKQADYIGRWLGAKAGLLTRHLSINHYNALIPVPLHPRRKRKRGYNQSEQIALGISHIWNIPVMPELTYRKVNTSTQTRLNREERRQNIAGVFGIKQGRSVPARCVIVDDILTTGATTCELGRTLHEAGAEKIGIMTLGTPFTHHGIRFSPDIDETDIKP
ncbi:MAG: ComF family protein [Candidatus Marinimicrobia bacterium]|nr:ComF family protein [Candidatus Neomarinimicrobiota bacterium]